MRLLLFGNPNVGKSAVFSRLTGLEIISANYPGTTVSYTKGTLSINQNKMEVYDVPGTYSLIPTSAAEEVATRMFNDATDEDIIINIVDATNLERNLFLTLQLLEKKIPTIIVLNKWDLTKPHGIEINAQMLSALLDIPVIPIIGISGEGVKELVSFLAEFVQNPRRTNTIIPPDNDGKWQLIGQVCSQAQKITHRHPTVSERLQLLTVTMPHALIIALVVLVGTFAIVRFVGENLINHVLDPLFNNVYLPFITSFINNVTNNSGIHKFLLGTIPKPMESFGLLTTGFYIPLVVVFPYILAFYFVLSFLEDSGYLVRLAVVLDRFFHKLGLHGYASIPFLLGMGCKVPAVLSTRILETRREKIIATVLILTMTPCMPQTAMIFSVLGGHGIFPPILVFFILVIIGLISGLLLNKVLKGETPELFVEIPLYQLPQAFVLFKKLYVRLKEFFLEAVPMIFLGIALINILDILGMVQWLTKVFGPFLTNILGLPKDMALVMVSGFLRKDVSIALLTPFHLSIKQLIVASVVLVIYLPCLATFSIILKEFKAKDGFALVGALFCAAIAIGSVLNLLIP